MHAPQKEMQKLALLEGSNSESTRVCNMLVARVHHIGKISGSGSLGAGAMDTLVSPGIA